MIALYISLGVLAFLIIILLIIAKISHDKFFGYHYEGDPNIPLYTNEEFNVSKEEIEFKDKKATLRGYLYYKDNYNPNRIVIYAHGMFSDHENYMQDICYFATRGFLVLGFNYYGVSTSDGKNLRSFGNSIEGLDYAIRYVKSNEKLKDKDIYVVGHSWGGYATTNIVKFHPDIKAICALSPFNSNFDIINHTLHGALKIVGLFVTLIDDLIGGKYSRCKANKSLDNYPGRVLLIQSDDDNVVDINIGVNKILKKTKNKNIKSLILTGKHHQPHYTLEAIKVMTEYEQKARMSKGDDLVKLKKETDFHKMGELDSEVMDQIVKLFEE